MKEAAESDSSAKPAYPSLRQFVGWLYLREGTEKTSILSFPHHEPVFRRSADTLRSSPGGFHVRMGFRATVR